ncbi:MAG: 50S ribosomal protein L27 [Candidatus Andersenbacteria bacterium]
MAHKKAGGSTSLGRESHSKRLGVKIYGGESVSAGQIIIRQRGSRYREGQGVRRGSDDTLYAASAGIVRFTRRHIKRFTGALKKATFVSVEGQTK